MDFSKTLEYYWLAVKYTVLNSYYYYFQPTPPDTVFLLLEVPDCKEINILADVGSVAP